MDCADYKEQIDLLLPDSLDESQRRALEKHLEGCPDCQAEFEASRKIWDLMGEIPSPEPPASIRARFNIALSNYAEEMQADQADKRLLPAVKLFRQLWSYCFRPQFAYGILLLGVGFLAGYLLNRPEKMSSRSSTQESTTALNSSGTKGSSGATGSSGTPESSGEKKSGQGGGASQAAGSSETKSTARTPEAPEIPVFYSRKIDSLSSQVSEMKQMMMLALLENPSASQRIRGVEYTGQIGRSNKKVIAALLTTLNEDPNVNVRLITLEALSRFSKDPSVREGLVQSITQQESPLLQSAIADVMVKLQEKRSILPFEKLLLKKDLNETVKLKIEQSIRKLI